jgi:hypothetical protein
MASPIAWTEVTSAFPELGSVTSDYGEFVITYINSSALDVSNFGGEDAPKTRLARMYLAAHFAATVLRGIAPGPLTGEREGDISRSYGVPRMDWQELQLTAYGQAYCALIQSTPARAGFVT